MQNGEKSLEPCRSHSILMPFLLRDTELLLRVTKTSPQFQVYFVEVFCLPLEMNAINNRNNYCDIKVQISQP